MMQNFATSMVVFVVFAPFLFGHVTAADECVSANADGTCGDETSVLLQSRLDVDSFEDTSTEQLSFSEEAKQNRHASRARLVLETDFRTFDSRHYRAYDPNLSVDENIRAAFDHFCTTSDLLKELTGAEHELFFNRFKEMLKVYVKHDGNTDWAAEVAKALQHEKPVLSEALIKSLNGANLGYEVKLQSWMENLSQDDFDRQMGTHAPGNLSKDLNLQQVNLRPAPLIPHNGPKPKGWIKHASYYFPPTFDSATAWPKCSSVIGRIHSEGQCGSCWAFGALSALDSRLCIKTNGAFSGDRAMLSRGFVTSCAYDKFDGCKGGWPTNAYDLYKDAAKAGVSGGTLGCSPYFGHGESTAHMTKSASAPPCPTQCDASFTTRTMSSDRYHFPDLTYVAVLKHPAAGFLIAQMDQLRHALAAGGPVAFVMLAENGFMAYKSGSYYYKWGCRQGPDAMNHAATAIGYDKVSVTALNSWGDKWGDNGRFKVDWCMVNTFFDLDMNDMRQAPNPLVPGGPTQAPHTAPPTQAPTVRTTTTTVAPTQGPPPAGATVCNFEPSSAAKPYCGIWVDKTSGDEFDWTRTSGSTPTGGTGPFKHFGHLLNNIPTADKGSYSYSGSYYLFIEASSPRKPGDRAILEACGLTIGKGAYLTLRYSMNGRHIGKLEIKADDKQMWVREGPQGGTWNEAYADLSTMQGQGCVSIVATRGSSYKGDIAIDEVVLYPGTGGSAPTQAPTSAPPTQAPTPPPTQAPTQTPVQPPAGSCPISGHFLTKKCAQCVYNAQCKSGEFCCPFMKLCVKTSRDMCAADIATCRPLCHEAQPGYPGSCACSNSKFPNNWVSCPPRPDEKKVWNVISGSCTKDAAGCIMSPNYPAQYPINHKCDITVQANSQAIEVVDYNVESPSDEILFNGYKCPGQFTIHGQEPTTNMVWSSDSSATDSGWKLCPRDDGLPPGDPRGPTRALCGPTQAPTQAPSGPTQAPSGPTQAPTQAPTPPPTQATTRPPAPPPTQAPTPATQGPTQPPPPSGATVCEFEWRSGGSRKPYCGMWADKKGSAGRGSFDWTRKAGRTRTSRTGPSKGMGKKSKYSYAYSGWNYLYIETSSPRRAGDKATLEACGLTIGNGAFLTLRYSMNGMNTGRLEIKVGDTQLWVKDGHQGKTWNEAHVDLSTQQGQGCLSIVATRGSSYRGDIAIDDVVFFPGN